MDESTQRRLREEIEELRETNWLLVRELVKMRSELMAEMRAMQQTTRSVHDEETVDDLPVGRLVEPAPQARGADRLRRAG